MSGTQNATAGVLEARGYDKRWGVGLKLLFQGDDRVRVNRREENRVDNNLLIS